MGPVTPAPTAAPAPVTPAPTAAPTTTTVGNDPIIKVNGDVYKFHLKAGVRTPLLSWTNAQSKGANDEFVKFELLGTTFKPRTLQVKEDAQGYMSIVEDAQWFGQVALMANDKVVLNVTRGVGGFGGMGIQVDGKHKPYDADKWVNKFVAHTSAAPCADDACDVEITLGRLKKHVGDKFAQALVVHAPELRFSIETMPALKFTKAEDKIHFGHLNLKFDGTTLPGSSRGLLAQLAGARTLTQHSKDRYNLQVRKHGKDVPVLSGTA
jgi:hypothetical protein